MQSWKRREIVRLPVAATLAGLGVSARAQDAAAAYPSKIARIVVPYVAGGGTDVTARLIAQKLSERWGRQVLVENRPGGNTNIASQAVARAEPDGHTLLLVNPTFTINPLLSSNLPFDVSKDFVPVATVAAGPWMMVVHPSVPANDLKSMLALLRAAKPGEWDFATVGGSGIGRVVGELFALQAGVKLQHISYKGAAQVVTDMIGGVVKLTIDPPGPHVPHVKQGKLKALAVTSRSRLSSLPQVPTFAEQGMPEFDVRSWNGLLVTGGTPKAVVQKIAAAVTEVLALPDVKEKLASMELEPLGGTPEQFASLLQSETERYGRVVKAAGIKAAE